MDNVQSYKHVKLFVKFLPKKIKYVGFITALQLPACVVFITLSTARVPAISR